MKVDRFLDFKEKINRETQEEYILRLAQPRPYQVYYDMVKSVKHPTTRSHYEKYENLRKNMGVKLDADSLRMFDLFEPTVDWLAVLYVYDDGLLNRIPLKVFDGFYYIMRGRLKASLRETKWAESVGYSLAENTCLYKHCLIYQVLGLEPEFEGE